MRDFAEIELASLRRELELRILLQNSLLIGLTCVFAVMSSVSAVSPQAAWSVAAGFNVVALSCSLQWCHHGVRTAQLKQYLMKLHPDANAWETWLPRNRPAKLLGTRWMVSTKGVFLGLSLAMILLAAIVDRQTNLSLAGASFLLWCLSAWFLTTNPKE